MLRSVCTSLYGQLVWTCILNEVQGRPPTEGICNTITNNKDNKRKKGAIKFRGVIKPALANQLEGKIIGI